MNTGFVVIAIIMLFIAIAVVRWLATVVRQLNTVERNYTRAPGRKRR